MTDKQQLQGFYEEVTLSTGVVVRIRKVDLDADHQASLRDVVTKAIMKAGAENAAEGARLLKSVMDADDRPEDLMLELAAYPDLMLNMGHDGEVSLLTRGCKSPSLPELVELYEGDMSLPDLGLGPDYSLLLAYIRNHSKLIAATAREVAEAQTFPAGVGNSPRRGKQKVQPPTE